MIGQQMGNILAIITVNAGQLMASKFLLLPFAKKMFFKLFDQKWGNFKDSINDWLSDVALTQ